MQVSTKLLNQQQVRQFSKINDKIADAQERISTGKNILRASDDPVAAVNLSVAKEQSLLLSQFRRNIEELISLQTGDPQNPTKLGFQDMFGVMIAGVGSSVNSSKIAVDIQEENMMAAKEAEAEFSGVNLDTEAAALIEFQQAYQASARILSTARELFQSLMEVV